MFHRYQLGGFLLGRRVAHSHEREDVAEQSSDPATQPPDKLHAVSYSSDVADTNTHLVTPTSAHSALLDPAARYYPKS